MLQVVPLELKVKPTEDLERRLRKQKDERHNNKRRVGKRPQQDQS